MGLRLTINVMRRGQSLEQLTFHSDTQHLVKVGKRPTDHVVVHDPSVSQIRARITLNDHEAALLDLGTTGGISVNGFRVREATLQEGDQVQIGQITLVVTGCALVEGVSSPFGPVEEGIEATPVPVVSAVDAKLRVVSKLNALSAEGLVEAERAIDLLLPRFPNQSATAGAFERPADPWGTAFAQTPSKPAVKAPPTASMGVTLPSPPPAPQMAPSTFAPPSDGVSKLAFGGAAAPLNPPGPVPVVREKYDTDFLVDGMRKNRHRTYALVTAGLAVVAVVSWWITAPKEPAAPLVAPSEESAAAAPPEAAAPAPDAAAPEGEAVAGAEAAPKVAAPTADDRHAVYTLKQERSLADVSTWLWGGEHVAELLVKANPQVSGPDLVLEPGTVIRVPRTTTATVGAGETLGVIAKTWLGDPRLYAEVHAANASTMATPDDVAVGMQITIPLLCEPVRKKLEQ